VWYCANFCTTWLGAKLFGVFMRLVGKDVQTLQSVKLID
jgi:hypothetical protein